MLETTLGTDVAEPPPGDRGAGPRGRILVVDDDEGIRAMLTDLLGAGGHEVATVGDGPGALALMGRNAPELVLLDIYLPGLDGTDVLARMKGDPRLRHIPVVVITAYHDVAIAERCLRLGAEDYVQKPFRAELLRARVEGCLARHRLRESEAKVRRLLERSNRVLEDAVRERTKDLCEAHARLASLDRAKDDFLTLIAHELRTPVTGLQAAGQILVEGGLAEEERRELAAILQASLERLSRLVEDALALTRLRVEGQALDAKAWPLESILREAVEGAAPYAKARGVSIGPGPATARRVPCDPVLAQHAFAGLVEGAARFCAAGGTVTVAAESRGPDVVLRITGAGAPMDPEVVAKLLGVFSVVESVTPTGDLGLGLPLASRILHIFGGMVGVASPKEGGVLFTVRMPVAEEGA